MQTAPPQWDPGSPEALAALDPESREWISLYVWQADQMLQAGDSAGAMARYRLAVNHPRSGQRIRGLSAGLLGWLLLGDEPEQDIPDESRWLLDVAQSEMPRASSTLYLKAYILARDGDGRRSLRTLRSLRRLAKERSPIADAHLESIASIANAVLGRVAAARQHRDQAAGVWPECDLLAIVDHAIATAVRRMG